jgi:DNA-3-methyladenine glycosylase II
MVQSRENTVALPPYWEEAKSELMKRDRIMSKLIPKFGDLHLVGHDDPFTTLARSIVNQQVTPKAANVAWQKLLECCPKFTPAAVLKAGAGELAACGLSKRKTEYILDLADNFKARKVSRHPVAHDGRRSGDRRTGADSRHHPLDGRDVSDFNSAAAERAAAGRPGLIAGISHNYFSGEPVSRSDAREVSANWEPYRTVATWYLWRSLDPVPVE